MRCLGLGQGFDFDRAVDAEQWVGVAGYYRPPPLLSAAHDVRGSEIATWRAALLRECADCAGLGEGPAS